MLLNHHNMPKALQSNLQYMGNCTIMHIKMITIINTASITV